MMNSAQIERKGEIGNYEIVSNIELFMQYHLSQSIISLKKKSQEY